MNYRAIITASLLAFSAGCGGAEFTLQSAPAADTGNIVTTVDPMPEPDAQATLPTGDAGDASDAGDAGDASDAGDAGNAACDSGAPVMTTCAATNASGYIWFTAPTQYCSMYVQNLAGIITSQGLAVPSECLCNYTCDCLIASSADLCPNGGKFVNCQNDKGGLIVDCK
ncbi:MAG: hypothetical protein WBY94_08220 [Polyangiaceae bacterium]